MTHEQAIRAKDEEIERRVVAYHKALARAYKAQEAVERAQEALEVARQRRENLVKLIDGRKPYRCGKPYTDTFHGDQYRETTVSGVEDEVHWWSDGELAMKLRFPHPLVYIVSLKNNAKTPRALVYLDENASLKAATLRELMKLPKAT